MKTRRGRPRLWVLTSTVLASITAMAMLLPAMSSAASHYPNLQEPTSRDFNGGAGGWQGQATSGGLLSDLLNSSSGLPLPDLPGLGGLCDLLPLPILCSGSDATVEWRHEATGGKGGGYLSARGSGLVDLFPDVGTVWQSPPFVYKGDGGKQADVVTYKMDVLADGGSLFGLLKGFGAANVVGDLNLGLINLNLGKLENLQVEAALVADGGQEIPLIEPGSPLIEVLKLDPSEILSLAQSGNSVWKTVGPILVDPSKLTQNEIYRLRVTTTYNGLAGLVSVLPDYHLGIDNVALSAVAGGQPGAPGGPGTPGGPGGPGAGGKDGKDGQDGKGGKDGQAGLNGKAVLQAVKKSMPNTAVLTRNRRWIRVREVCPAKFNRRCQIRTVARLKRNGPIATRANRRVVGKGVRRTKALFVKPRFRKQAAKAKRVFIEATVKVGKVKVRVIKPARLVKR